MCVCVCVCVWRFVLTNILVLQLSPQTKIFGSASVGNYCCSSKIMTPCSFRTYALSTMRLPAQTKLL